MELNEEGVRRVHTGERDFWQETGIPDMAAYAQKWDLAWALGADEPVGGMGNLIDSAGTGDAGAYEMRMQDIRAAAEDFLKRTDVPHGEILPYGTLFANNRYEKTDTDIFVVLDFAQEGSGVDGRVGYSLFQGEIAFLDLHPEGDVGEFSGGCEKNNVESAGDALEIGGRTGYNMTSVCARRISSVKLPRTALF